MGADAQLMGRVVAGRFRVTGLVGEGAMAAVHRAVDLTQEDPSAAQVALKVMHEHLAGDATFVRRFRREAKAAAALRHPHSVRIVDYGIDGTVAYIAMELLVGQDLFQLIKHDGALAGRRAAEIMIQVCDALTAAHSRGILHRDLKPENVMLVRGAAPGEDMVKVLDFGVAKIVASEHRIEDAPTNITGTGLTSVGAVLGTPEYMSPEQCQGEPLDFRSDIYACGVLLYQLVTGQVPFSGETPVHTMLLHVREPPRPPRTLAPQLDAAIEAVILRALAKRPDDRYGDARQLGSALAEAIGRKVPWVPTDIGPPESAFAATPTPTGIPHLRSLGVALPPRAGAQAPSAYDETVHADEEPRQRAGASTAPLPTPPVPPRPARHTVPLHAPNAGAPSAQAPSMPETGTQVPGARALPGSSRPSPSPHTGAAAHAASSSPAPFMAMGGLGSTHVMPSASVPEMPAGPPRAALPAAPRAMAPAPDGMGGGALAANPFAAAARVDAKASQRSFAFHAVTFAVAFVVVLVTLTLIVFR